MAKYKGAVSKVGVYRKHLKERPQFDQWPSKCNEAREISRSAVGLRVESKKDGVVPQRKAEYDNGVSGKSRDGLAGSTCTAPPPWVRILKSLDPCKPTMSFTLSRGTIKVGEARSDLWCGGSQGPCG